MRAAKLDALSGFRLGLLSGLLVIGASFFVHREVWRHLDLWPLLFDNWAENCLFAASVISGCMTGAFSASQIDLRMKTAYKWAMNWGIPAFLFLYVAAAGLCERLTFGVWDHPVLRGLGVAMVLASIAFRIWAHVTVPELLRFSATNSGAIAGAAAAEPAIDENPQPQPDKAPSAGEESLPAAEEPPAAQEIQPPDVLEQPCKGTEASSSSGKVSSTDKDDVPTAGPYRWIRHPDRAGRVLFLLGAPLCFGAWMPLFALPGALVLLNWHLADLEAYCISQLGEPYLRYKERTKRLIPQLF
jgi:protein-S-isoprenylcysteine O-methyltransferase Ste14